MQTYLPTYLPTHPPTYLPLPTCEERTREKHILIYYLGLNLKVDLKWNHEKVLVSDNFIRNTA